MSHYYDREGNPLTLSEYIALMERIYTSDEAEIAYKRVAHDPVVDPSGEIVWISTVWLGLNHNFFDGPPHIFETMIFGGEYDQWQDRYPTEAAALAGHDQALAMVKDDEDGYIDTSDTDNSRSE